LEVFGSELAAKAETLSYNLFQTTNSQFLISMWLLLAGLKVSHPTFATFHFY